MKRAALLLFVSLGLFAAGSVQQTGPQRLGNTDAWMIGINWIGDASNGSVPDTKVAVSGGLLQGYLATQVEIAPGTPAPTAGYSITLKDTAGVDILGGLGASQLSTGGISIAVPSSSTPLTGTFTFSLSNQAVASAKGSVLIYFQKARPINVLTNPGALSVTALQTTLFAQKFFGTAPPGIIIGNLPGDFFTDTTNHNEYVCNAPSGTVAPACTSVSTAGWMLTNTNPAGLGITSLTGDVTATGPGAAVATLATVNGSPGSCGSGTVSCVPTTNGKGLVTSQTTATIAPPFTAITGTATAAQLPNAGVFTGDATTTFPALTIGNNAITAVKMVNAGVFTGDATSTFPAITLNNVNAGSGVCGSATASCIPTTNAKGLVTSQTTATITPAIGSVTGLGANVATFLGTPSGPNLDAALTSRVGKASIPSTTVYTDQLNTWGAFVQTFQGGANHLITDTADLTKKFQFDVSNVATGTTRTVNIPNANSTTIQSDTGASNNYISAVSAQGVITKSQPAFSNLSGSATCAQLPALTGDTTSSAGTCGTTTTKINGTSFAGTNGNLVSFGAANIPADSGFLATNVVRKDTTNAAAAAMSLDLSASTVANGFKVPVAAGATTTANGAIKYDSTNDMLHAGQASADAFVPQFTAVPANNDCVKWTVSGSNYKLNTAGAACGGTTTITDTLSFFASRDVGGTFMGPNTLGNNVSSTGTLSDTQSWTFNNAASPYIVIHTRLSATWTGAIDATAEWTQSAGGSGNVQFKFSTYCYVLGTSTTTPTYNTAQTVTTATGSANVLTASTQTSLTTTGCAAGNDFSIKVERTNGGADTYAQPVNVKGVVLVLRHT